MKNFLIGDCGCHETAVDMSEIVAIDSGQRMFDPEDDSGEEWLVDYIDLILKNGSILTIYENSCDDKEFTLVFPKMVAYISKKIAKVTYLSDILNEEETQNDQNP